MLVNKTTLKGAIGDVYTSYNAVGEINITRYSPNGKEKKKYEQTPIEIQNKNLP